MPRTPQKHSKRIVEQEKRRNEALRLRLKGLTFEQIGKELGITKVGALGAVKKSLKIIREENKELAEDLLHQELAMFAEMHAKLWDAFQQGDLELATKILAVSDRRTKLLDLQPATKHEVKGGMTFVLNQSDADL